ncbi:hypothetical protein [Salisediminibacterium halotolerans]|uniref:Ankyrin repeat-containing protein n=1 Tax=Salisediminibacterium halotolerans TaxID=517425 RepID=A0A1H9R7I0_9BACI|nr:MULTISPECIES: hypothetical protein [Salisediminibacterium]RLJ78263.1 hypothetical protein BCL39_0734 [Actinophytocola xinjiangensis]RPE88398.1 hypothetical protein EDD67_0725 [Salisediminibacterium halotolerans]TWG37240.1 hypothetical protein BCL52_0733 [Salisediminibacterium halotolerans]SER68831.1 hypothetical protein SAMN05444126_10458 [Salisediminibacterium haloalkalitolerans]GEL07720.1 hypothetical protein SHA02_11360 [Salisediminibacterium halotolerans]
MRYCQAKNENGAFCTNRAGADTNHPGVGYCSEHDQADRTVIVRSAAIGRIEANDRAGLAQLLDQDDVNINMSTTEYDTLLEHAVFRQKRAAAEELLERGAVIYRYDMPKTGRAKLLDKIESGDLARKVKFEKYTDVHTIDPELERQKKKEYLIAGTTVVIVVAIAYMMQIWDVIGAILSFLGLFWLLYAIVQRRRGVMDGEPIPYAVWTLCTGGFFTLMATPGSGADQGGIFGLIENVVFLLLFGFLLLWVLALVFRDDPKRKAVPLVIMFIISLLITGL